MEKKDPVQKLRSEIIKFEKTLNDFYYMKFLVRDLKNFRDMIKLKKFD